jgi:gamma-glutamyltranspeptidase/glutathione hydrolase
MLPTILSHPDGRRVVLGAGGSSRIPGAVLRSIISIVDLGLSVDEAVLDPAMVWHESWVESDPAVADEISSAVERMGLPIFRMPVGSGQHYGLLHVAAMSGAGEFSGCADRYWDGAAVEASG